MIASYFEWLQNKNGEIWQLEDTLKKLDLKLEESFNSVFHYAQKEGIDMRKAAYCIAIKRIEKAYIQRGLFP